MGGDRTTLKVEEALADIIFKKMRFRSGFSHESPFCCALLKAIPHPDLPFLGVLIFLGLF